MSIKLEETIGSMYLQEMLPGEDGTASEHRSLSEAIEFEVVESAMPEPNETMVFTLESEGPADCGAEGTAVKSETTRDNMAEERSSSTDPSLQFEERDGTRDLEELQLPATETVEPHSASSLTKEPSPRGRPRKPVVPTRRSRPRKVSQPAPLLIAPEASRTSRTSRPESRTRGRSPQRHTDPGWTPPKTLHSEPKTLGGTHQAPQRPTPRASRPPTPSNCTASRGPSASRRTASQSSRAPRTGSAKPAPVVTLDNIGRGRTVKGVLNSPRSLRVCESEGVRPAELLPRTLADFMGPGVPMAIAEVRYQSFEDRRTVRLARMQQLRHHLVLEDEEEKAEEERLRAQADEMDRRMQQANSATTGLRRPPQRFGASASSRTVQRQPTGLRSFGPGAAVTYEPMPRAPSFTHREGHSASSVRQVSMGACTSRSTGTVLSAYRQPMGSRALRSMSPSLTPQSPGEAKLLEQALRNEERMAAAQHQAYLERERRAQEQLQIELEKEQRSADRLLALERAKERVILLRRANWASRMDEVHARRMLLEQEKQLMRERATRRSASVDRFSMIAAKERYKTPQARA